LLELLGRDAGRNGPVLLRRDADDVVAPERHRADALAQPLAEGARAEHEIDARQIVGSA
jgi:hypothetical protein